jgi:hypothetical protein
VKKALTILSIAFVAGVFGAMGNSLVFWLFDRYDLIAKAGLKIAFTPTPAWLYPRIVWGGLWGLLFVLPLFRRSVLVRGFFFSLAPTAFQLFVVFPIFLKKGNMGLDLGTLTPAFVLFFNAVWGVCAASWMEYTAGK